MQAPQRPYEPYAPPAAAPVPSGQGELDPSVVLEPAGFWTRGLARVIDVVAMAICGAMFGAVGGVFVGVLGAAGVIAPGWERRVGHMTAGSFLVGMVASLGYHMFAEAFAGATVGKVIAGVRVLTDERKPCTLGKALGRNLGYYVDALFFGAVAWGAMSKSPTKQRLGDQWAGTIVVVANSIPDTARRSPAIGLLVGVGAYGFFQLVATVVKAL